MTTIEDIREPIADAYRAYEKAMDAILHSDEALIHEVLRYVHAKQGKQLRPLMVLLAAEICHGITDKSILSAVAVELLHNASLIHDDVVDNSPTRHGNPTVHARWSNKIAILMGDYLLAKMITCVADTRNNAIIHVVARLSESLSHGEIIQLHHESSMWIDEATYFKIIEKKTAQLFAACMEMGAESSGATQRQTTALREFGRQLGICFQLKDDVFDYSDSDDLGKPTMGDIRDGKATLPLIIALQRAPKEEADRIREMAERWGDDNDVEQEIKSFVLRYEGIRYAYAQMQTHKKSAIEALSIFHDSAAKRSLIQLLEYAINRLH